MATVRRSKATLRIFGDDLQPNEITSLLGCPPTTGRTKGESIPTRSGNRISHTGSWRLQAQAAEPADLDQQVKEILGKLTTDMSIWKQLGERFTLDLFCGLFMGNGNEGISLSPETLLALGQRGIEIGLDIYEGSKDTRKDA